MPVDLSGVKILVVEDSKSCQKLIAIILDSFECEIELVENGQEAIERIKTTRYDIILMNVQMPVMDGIKATEIIRRDINQEIPILAVTAAAMKGDREKCITCGMNDYLTKPIDQEKLAEMIFIWWKR